MQLKPIRLGDFVVTTPLVLAPMTGVSDLPFREVCTEHGAGLTVGEMLPSEIERWSTEKNRFRLARPAVPGPQVVQIAGSDPAQMAEAAALNVASGADVIDINMGCPAKKVLRKDAGSALLRDPALVERILRAVVAAVDVPVTLKIRTGWCPESRNGIEIARRAEQCGISLLTVHGRTRACRFKGEAEYDTIAAIKRAVGIPVIANGDITSVQKARQVLELTGADGLMIGRGAQGRPWLFAEVEAYLAAGKSAAPLPIDRIRKTVESHVGKIYAFYGQHKGVLFARKHVGWYARALTEGNHLSAAEVQAFWPDFTRQESAAQQAVCLRRFFDAMNQNNNRGLAA